MSFLNDASSEMIYPMLPAFLATLGATPVTLGALEGFAEATASMVKVFSGRLSDRSVPKKPLIVAGYGVSNLVRPLIGLVTGPLLVIVLRVIDRLGKGLRSAPRDALIAAVTPKEDRGNAFGFHQGMDHWGGVVGPLVASGLLLLPWFDPRRVFFFTIIPGLLCVGLTLLLADPGDDLVAEEKAPTLLAPRPLQPRFWRFLAVQSVFSLAASSDTFLLLRAQGVGVPIPLIAMLWAVHNAVRALFSRWGGRRSDRVGRRRSLVTGWLVYAATYAGFALVATPAAVILLFLFYAGYFAMTDGAEKAFVADLSDATNRGFAFGITQGASGVMLLAANLLMGLVWTRFGPPAAFFMCALASALAAVLLRLIVPEPVSSGAPTATS
ncbi:MAG: MFS transporter [Vicinamibacteria bacterium]